MEQQLTEIREQQKETWNKFSPGWKKWDDFTMNFLKPMGDAIIEELNIKEDDVSIKATTNEKMGFIGREEGLAAYATVLLKSGI